MPQRVRYSGHPHFPYGEPKAQKGVGHLFIRHTTSPGEARAWAQEVWLLFLMMVLHPARHHPSFTLRTLKARPLFFQEGPRPRGDE